MRIALGSVTTRSTDFGSSKRLGAVRPGVSCRFGRRVARYVREGHPKSASTRHTGNPVSRLTSARTRRALTF